MVCAGVTLLDGFAGASHVFYRYTPNGQIDTDFGINGFVDEAQITAIIPAFGNIFVRDMCIQTDDKILIMGLIQSSAFYNKHFVLRLMPNGNLDTTFNSTGFGVYDYGFAADLGYAIALQPDGRIIIGGSAGNNAENFGLMRLNTNGTLDTTFGMNGKVVTPMNPNESSVRRIIVLNDGKIMVAGIATDTNYNLALAKYDPNGSLDTSFGTNGKVITMIQPYVSDGFVNMVVKSNGKILVGGITNYFNNSNGIHGIVFIQYNSNGTLDSTFDSDGIKIIQDYDMVDFVLQTDEKIVCAAGGVYTTPNEVIRAMRFNTDASFDPSFGNNGIVDLFENSTYQKSSTKVIIQSDNKIILVMVLMVLIL